MANILSVENLFKNFGTVHAVNGVSFDIPEGICFGLLGPNGAGKTTTIEIMEGITAPSSGRVLFRGKPLDKNFKKKVGIQFQSTALPEFITVRETIELFSAFYPDPRPIDEVIALCSLDDILDRDNRKLSGGQRQRMLLALAIIPRPEIVFLDEPPAGTAQFLGPHKDDQGGKDNRHPHHPLHGRSAAPVRPDRDNGPGEDTRNRYAGHAPRQAL